MSKIERFNGECDFLSNMYSCPVVHNGMWYQNAESAYQASKCSNPFDRQQFTGTDGYQAKQLIRNVSHKSDFGERNLLFMTEIVLDKFYRNPELMERLVKTGYSDIEENNSCHDDFWGVDKDTGKGDNWLGKILMSTRTLIRDDMQEISISYKNGSMEAARLFCGEAEIYTAETNNSQLPPYQSAVKPEYIKMLTEKHIAVLTGETANDGKRNYPVMAFNPEMVKYLKNGCNYDLQAGITPQSRQTAQEMYKRYDNAYIQVQNYEYWLGLKVNENQFLKDILKADCSQSRCPFRHTANNLSVDYDIVNISKESAVFEAYAIISGDERTFRFTADRTMLAKQNIGKGVMNYVRRQLEMEINGQQRNEERN